jgi:hypothetical protein
LLLALGKLCLLSGRSCKRRRGLSDHNHYYCRLPTIVFGAPLLTVRVEYEEGQSLCGKPSTHSGWAD